MSIKATRLNHANLGIICVVFVLAAATLSAGFLYTTDETKKEKKKSKIRVILTHEQLPADTLSRQQLICFLKIADLIKRENQKKSRLPPADDSIRKIKGLLHQAAGFTVNLAFKNYLKALLLNVENSHLVSPVYEWLNSIDHQVDLVLVPPEETGNVCFYVLIYKPIQSEKVNRIFSLADKIQRQIYPKAVPPGIDISLMPFFRVADVAAASDYQNHAMVFPSELRTSSRLNYRVIVFDNLLTAYFQKIIHPIGNKILAKELAERVSYDSYFTYFILHRLCHFFAAPYDVDKSKEKKVQLKSKRFKSFFYSFEEIRADVSALLQAELLTKEAIIKRVDALYATYFITLLHMARQAKDISSLSPALFQLTFLFKSEAVTYEIKEKRVFINDRKFKHALNSMRKAVLKMDEAEAGKILQEQEKIPKVLHRLLSEISDLPRQLEINSRLTLPEHKQVP